MPSASVTSPHGDLGGRRQRRPGGVRGVGVEREDRGDVRAGRARQAQAVLLGAGVRALVRAHPPRAVVLDAHPAEEAPPRERLPVGSGVVLRVRPQRGLAVAHERALQLPALEQLARRGVRVGVALGKVDRDDVERRARDQRAR